MAIAMQWGKYFGSDRSGVLWEYLEMHLTQSGGGGGQGALEEISRGYEDSVTIGRTQEQLNARTRKYGRQEKGSSFGRRPGAINGAGGGRGRSQWHLDEVRGDFRFWKLPCSPMHV